MHLRRRPPETLVRFALILCATYMVFSDTRAEAQENAPANQQKGVEVILYPILVEAPIFGATINLPSLPSGGGGERGSQSSSTDVSLNAAYMAGIDVRTSRFFGELRGQYAALSASRATPLITVDSNTYFFYG